MRAARPDAADSTAGERRRTADVQDAIVLHVGNWQAERHGKKTKTKNSRR